MQSDRAVIASIVASLAIALTLSDRVCAFPDQPVPSASELIDSPMYKSPDLPKPDVEWVFPEGAIKLWLAALERPDAESKYRAAEAIARARTQGVKGLESAVPRLLTLFDEPAQLATVRLAAARALVALDARDAAPRLFHQLETADDDLRDVIEPALARWDHRPIRPVWLARFKEAEPRSRHLILAMQGLAQVREDAAVEPLRKIVLSNREAATHRLEAARALGQLREAGLEKDAEGFSTDATPADLVGRLCAVRMLQRHSSQAAVQLLQRLTLDDQPAVAADAVERLLTLDAKHVVPSLNDILASADPRLRSLGVEALLRQPSEAHIGLLSKRLGDVHPEVRGQARQALRELAAKQKWRNSIISNATEALASRNWRSLEQAAILLTQVEHKPSTNRFVQLLDFERPEVFVAAAWGLRKLAVPETVPAVVRHIEARVKQLSTAPGGPANKPVPFDMVDHEMSQLLQFVGMQRYAKADDLLRSFIPKPSMGRRLGHESRAAAIWSLGMIHEGKNKEDLASALEDRLNDVRSIPPEDNRVRWMCAYSLGRMKATKAVGSLGMFYLHKKPTEDPVNNACGWAIEQITGEKMPAPQTIRKPQRDWFLIPQNSFAP